VEKVCGEFLSREAGLYLAALGLDLPSLGAVPIHAVRLCSGGRVVTVKLPFAALGLSRRVLDEALLGLASSAGAHLQRGLGVHELSRRGADWVARLEGGAVLEANAAFLATGKHDLRRHKRPPGGQDDLVAFKMHWRLSARQAQTLDGHVELVLFDDGYAGLQPVEFPCANLCLLVRKRRLRSLGSRWEELLRVMRAESPNLSERLTGAEPRWARPLALSAIPYGHLQRRADDHLWRLGDQAAVIPSFSGDGMSIALHSAELAAATFLEGGTADAYQRRLSLDVAAQVRLATVLSQGMVRRAGQAAFGAAARAWPGLVSAVASRTRVPQAALSRAIRAGAP
jgi:flavin-dependent dehydrogenase